MARTAEVKKEGLSELWQRLKVLLIALLVYRIGAHIPVSGIDPRELQNLFENFGDGLVGLFNVFSGGSLERMSIFALGIIPYISASIIVQLLTAVVPTFEKLKKEGQDGRKKLSSYTRYLTLIIALIQSFGITSALVSQGVNYDEINTNLFFIGAFTSFVAGSMFLMWLGEQITAKGIGNGMSILIFASIVSTLPIIFAQMIEQTRQGDLSYLGLLGILLLFIIVFFIVVFVEKALRKIPIQYPKNYGNQMMSANSSFLPLKINMAGVIPAIFASGLLLFPVTLARFTTGQTGIVNEIVAYISPGQVLYYLIYCAAIIFFCFFYTAIVFDPKDIANNLKKSGAFIPGLRPGDLTVVYIDGIITRLTIFGSLYIAGITVIPQIFSYGAGILYLFTGTSILIIVVVIIDLINQIQDYILSAKYESILRKNRFMQRTT